ncbi:ATPase [Roseateles sp. DAIF2]|uniref:SRPBCC family protein n=1 Tax=Roseateles sp. DAIF2 TaxID=2714952 RepID=UPI0018A2BC12|nr:SRPBCC family protein [Roseateles sp. DAIF2]QPF74704.1 ATPase [Roseateles sp. DAIF2]
MTTLTDPTPRSARHTSFVLERPLPATPARVFRAWADPEAKRRWSDCHAGNGSLDYRVDFRVGGRESYRARLPDGRLLEIEKVFLEILPAARILFAYTMVADGRSLSASLVTVEFEEAAPAGTLLRLTEQLAYLDGHEDLEMRRRGTAEGLDRLLLEVADAAPTG